MFALLEQYVIPLLEQLYNSIGYVGLALAMLVENACIPLPSELTLPMAGWMVAREQFDLWIAIFAAVAGGTIGSVIAYAVGYYGGRPLIARWGKYILISMDDLDSADRWFRKYGRITVFVGRLLPVVRTFISLPAGITRMPFWQFLVYSVAGAIPWTFALIYVGKTLNDNWIAVKQTLSGVDYIIVGILVLGILYYFYHHIRKALRPADQEKVD